MEASDFIMLLGVVGSVLAAVVAGGFSLRANDASKKAARSAALVVRQEQISEPIVELLHRIFDTKRKGAGPPPEEAQETLGEFLMYVQIYGSDATLRCTHRWMQATYSDAPGPVLLRLAMELITSIRHDSQIDSKADYRLLLGLRLNDLYATDMNENADLALRDYCNRYDWAPPWPRSMDD